MKQCRMDCIHIDAYRRFADNSTYWNSGDCPIYKSAADVAPKSEVAREFITYLKRMFGMCSIEDRMYNMGVYIISKRDYQTIIEELEMKYTEEKE